MAEVVLTGVSKAYSGAGEAVRDVNLRIADRELFVLVGPSGSGKSTLLRMVAGLVDVSRGSIAIDGRQVNDLTPGERDVAMVFQDQVLYPHQTVEENLGFGLRLRRLARGEITRRVRSTADRMRLTELLERRPAALSVGERQEVAIGRAIVRAPKLFLMDEPLAGLDARRRARYRAQLVRLQRSWRVTTLYVTNDQVEAMALGDRVGVLRAGGLQQVDVPQALYDRPRNLFVAGFLGSPPINAVEAVVQAGGRADWLTIGDQRIRLDARLPAALRARDGHTVTLGVRPEHLLDAELARDHPSEQVLFSTADSVERTGPDVYVHFSLPARAVAAPRTGRPRLGAELVARVQPDSRVRPGDRVEIGVAAGHVHLFDPVTGEALWHGG